MKEAATGGLAGATNGRWDVRIAQEFLGGMRNMERKVQ